MKVWITSRGGEGIQESVEVPDDTSGFLEWLATQGWVCVCSPEEAQQDGGSNKPLPLELGVIIERYNKPEGVLVTEPGLSSPQELLEVLAELVDLVDAARNGEYEIDSFTTQPARRMLSENS